MVVTGQDTEIRQLAAVNDVIAAPMADVWAVLTDFANPQRLAASIDSCTVSGSGVGAIRIVGSSRGLTIHERLLECDLATGRYRYEVLPEGDMPFADVTSYECTVILSALPDGATRIVWSTFGGVRGPVAPITEFLGPLYQRATDRIRAEVTPR